MLLSKKNKKKEINYGSETVRLKFAKARKFINPVNYIIQMGYRSKGRLLKRTPVGRAMATILREAMVGEYPAITVDPARAKLSLGILGVPAVKQLGREGARITLTWGTEAEHVYGDLCQPDDRVILCAYAVEQELAAVNDVEVIRGKGALEMELPEGMEHLPVHLYLIVHDRNKINFSNSKYLGFY